MKVETDAVLVDRLIVCIPSRAEPGDGCVRW